ncbi:acyl-CoA dehydrogenase family protein [Alkalibacillus aidingensis]|uniref:acyl-CoA dehydrogenase family protein n=1 Tax=Alkalibacillus aidingensis TaxID=2747607 RepID=UPI00166046CE|nr:acyl-CoA dehydrogenase family protein [Alkalibacillus aidingensis]
MSKQNFYTSDPLLKKILQKNLSTSFFEYADARLTKFGEKVANDIDERAVHTDRDGQPCLVKYNQMGEEINQVWVNEGYLQTVDETYRTGIVGYVHKEIPELGRAGNYLYSYAQGYLLSHAEPGFYCPVTLTMATAYLIDHYADGGLRQRFLPHVIATGDEELYEGATFLTERQGGSDVGANEVEAREEDGHYRLYGEKYFASNAGMCGVAMVLARMEGAEEGTRGLSLFLVPWEENRVEGRLGIRRLKDKLGVRAVPSAEVELYGAKAFLVGDPSQGFKYMMEALNLSRVCNAVASLGIMRRAYLESRDYALNREAFGNKLIDYPMIQETLANLAAKLEIETVATFDLVNDFDRVMKKGAEPSEEEQVMLRLKIALLKKETAEQAISFAHEAIEMHGGNGYIEDFVTPRLLRDAQVLTVWEGTANILGLEVLRLIEKFGVHELFVGEIRKRLGELTKVDEELINQVEATLGELQKILTQIQGEGERAILMHPKKIALHMTKILEATTALEMADEETNERTQAIAETFLKQTFSSQPSTHTFSQEHFEKIIQ